MSQSKSSKGKLIVVILAMLVLAMSSLACSAVEEMSSGYKKAEAANPLIKPWVPPSQRGDLTVEQENALLAEVEFSLQGNPSGEVAVFVDEIMCIRLTVDKSVKVPLEGNDRCSVNLRILNTEGDWEHVRSISCIDHTPYASIGFDVNKTSAKVSEGTWR